MGALLPLPAADDGGVSSLSLAPKGLPSLSLFRMFNFTIILRLYIDSEFAPLLPAPPLPLFSLRVTPVPRLNFLSLVSPFVGGELDFYSHIPWLVHQVSSSVVYCGCVSLQEDMVDLCSM